MAEIDASYQPDVGFEQGGSKIFVKDTGYIKFYDTDLSGLELKALLYEQATSNYEKAEIKSSGGALSTVNLPQGFIYINLSTGASNASAWLPSCSAGNEIKVVLQNFGGESVLSVFVSMSGCSLVGTLNSDLSSISLHTSAASAAWIHFRCHTAGEWSITAKSADHLIAEHSIS